MDSNSEQPNVVRLAWISGGVVALDQPGADIDVKAGMNGPLICALRINTYDSLFAALRQKGFSILGATFVIDPKELEGFRRPEFRSMGSERGWLVSNVKHQWRQIAVAAGNGRDMYLMDIASRIASGLRSSEMRLNDLATAYSIQLGAHLHENEAREYQAFQDANSFEVYNAIHALFWQMAVLRDALAEFTARICFSRSDVRTMKGLRKLLLTNSGSDALFSEILAATDQSCAGWLANFSGYRNCFTHVAPMEQAAGIAFTVQDMRKISSGLSIPQIYYALPQNVEEIERRRSGGAFVGSLEEMIAGVRRRRDRTLEPDALDYLHRCINLFGDLALKLISRLPITPRTIEMGPDDIVGEIRVTTSGTN